MPFSILRPPLVGIGRTPIERAVLTTSGGLQTDATRLAAVDGDGGDIGDGFGIWPAATNLVTNGGFETNTTGWEGAGGTIARITTDGVYGTSCLEVTVAVAADIAGARRSAGEVVDAATEYTASLWLRASTGTPTISIYAVEYTALDAFVQTNAAVGIELSTASWQRIPITFTTSGTTGIVRVYAATYGSQTATFKVDGVQLELGAAATPYIETDGDTESRTAGRVQQPVSGLFTATQGWVYGATTFPFANTALSTGIAVLWEWYDDTDNYLRVAYDWANNRVSFIRRASGSQTESTVAATFSANGTLTWGADWTSTEIAAIANGTRATPSADTNIPTLSAASSDIGSAAGSASFLNGNDRHVESGSGTLTDADAARLHGIGDTLPGIDRVRQAVSGKALVTSAWRARNGSFERLAA